MRNQYIWTGIALIGMLWFAGCSRTNYNDFIEVNTQLIDAMDVYTSDLEDANDAGSVADAIVQFADRMEVLAPEMKKLRTKYPEWSDKTKIPEELRALNEKAEMVMQRLPQSLMKSMQYMRDANVVSAMQRMQEAMSKMQ